MKLAFNFLLSNCLFYNFGNFSYQQITGVPKGSDQAPFMANQFLCYYENKWLLDTKKKWDLREAHIFSNKFRFMEDLFFINYYLGFDSNFKNIYPSEVQLRKKNISIFEASFLCIIVIIQQHKEFLFAYWDYLLIKDISSPPKTIAQAHNQQTSSSVKEYISANLFKQIIDTISKF